MHITVVMHSATTMVLHSATHNGTAQRKPQWYCTVHTTAARHSAHHMHSTHHSGHAAHTTAVMHNSHHKIRHKGDHVIKSDKIKSNLTIGTFSYVPKVLDSVLFGCK